MKDKLTISYHKEEWYPVIEPVPLKEAERNKYGYDTVEVDKEVVDRYMKAYREFQLAHKQLEDEIKESLEIRVVWYDYEIIREIIDQ